MGASSAFGKNGQCTRRPVRSCALPLRPVSVCPDTPDVTSPFWLVMHFRKQGQPRPHVLAGDTEFSVLSLFERNSETRKERTLVCFAFSLLTYAQLSFADVNQTRSAAGRWFRGELVSEAMVLVQVVGVQCEQEWRRLHPSVCLRSRRAAASPWLVWLKINLFPGGTRRASNPIALLLKGSREHLGSLLILQAGS